MFPRTRHSWVPLVISATALVILRVTCGALVSIFAMWERRGKQDTNKSATTSGGLVVEEDSVAGEHVVSLPVVDHDPVRVQLGTAVGGPVNDDESVLFFPCQYLVKLTLGRTVTRKA